MGEHAFLWYNNLNLLISSSAVQFLYHVEALYFYPLEFTWHPLCHSSHASILLFSKFFLSLLCSMYTIVIHGVFKCIYKLIHVITVKVGDKEDFADRGFVALFSLPIECHFQTKLLLRVKLLCFKIKSCNESIICTSF